MDELVHATVQWVQASLKSSPYIYSAACLNFPLGVQVLLAVAILHRDEATVRRQLISLQRIDRDNDAASDGNLKPNDAEKTNTNSQSADQVIELSPVASCTTIKAKSNQHTDAKSKYNNCCMFAVDSHQTDDQGITIWNSLDQRAKPALSDPLVQAGGRIVMSFADPAVLAHGLTGQYKGEVSSAYDVHIENVWMWMEMIRKQRHLQVSLPNIHFENFTVYTSGVYGKAVARLSCSAAEDAVCANITVKNFHVKRLCGGEPVIICDEMDGDIGVDCVPYDSDEAKEAEGKVYDSNGGC
ncbi:hypothetical protein F52700_4565 [Fusarium sp. NRRL 52700]|nr:hypothetical protein F52700_4565 [Fusarium sp. NRRL 52700]